MVDDAAKVEMVGEPWGGGDSRGTATRQSNMGAKPGGGDPSVAFLIR